MIAQIKGGTAPDKRVGYLAFRLTDQGTWVPIDGTVQESGDQAGRQCIEALERQVHMMHGLLAVQMASVQASLARLLDVPQLDDRIYIKGRRCQLADDGSLVVPVGRSKKTSTRTDLHEHVTDSVYHTLRKVLKLGGKREKSIALIVDLVLEEPFELLDKVASEAPDELGTIARFAVELYRIEHSLDAPQKPGESDERGAT